MIVKGGGDTNTARGNGYVGCRWKCVVSFRFARPTISNFYFLKGDLIRPRGCLEIIGKSRPLLEM